MTILQGNFTELGAAEIVGRLYASRRTGVLNLERTGVTESFYFVSGELYLDRGHDLAAAAEAMEPEEWLGARHGAPEDPLEPFIERLASWGQGSYEFDEGIGNIRTDLIGPFPVPATVMGAAVRGCSELDLLKALGGEDRAFVAAELSGSGPGQPQLDRHEAFFLSRMDRPLSVKEAVRQADIERYIALEKLCRLKVVGLIIPEDQARTEDTGEVLTTALIERFLTRIADSIERLPLDLDPGEHRRQLSELMGNLGELTHYQLLGVDMSSTAEEIHDAYSKLARLVHPVHAESLGLAGRESALQLLFERATEAYLTLSDKERSRDYLLRLGPESGDARSRPSAEARVEEARELARRNFKLARGMAQREEYHFAIELLNQIIRTDPRAEYYALLAECQSRNPQWQQKAVFSYRKALELDPGDASLHCGLARTLEQLGQISRARDEYSAALERMPGLDEAIEGLERLRRRSTPGRKKKQGRLSRLWSLLKP